ncbi:MAG: hypothetical protein Q9217_005704 [Psora testacea]
MSQLHLPPLPSIRITGRSHDQEDFALKLNLLPYILPPASSSKSSPYLNISHPEALAASQSTTGPNPTVPPALRHWIRKFTTDKSSHRTFTLTRGVQGWDTELLEGRLRTLLATKLGYKGTVSIVFPLRYAKLVVHTPNPPGVLDHAISFFSSGKKQEVKNYEVVEAVWPYAKIESSGGEGGEAGQMVPVVMGEDKWFQEWRRAIAYAVCKRGKGWVTQEDRMDVALDPGKGEMTWRERLGNS